jgi:tRNA U55 pseudouridine synthase TruB
MGLRLGCGAHLKSLVRTGIGRFSLAEAITLQELQMQVKGGNYGPLIPLHQALPDKPKIDIKPEYCRSVLEGKPFIKRYLSRTDYKGPGGCLSLLLGPDSKVLAIANLNYNWGSFERLDGRDVLGKYVRIIDEGHIRQERS